MKINLPESRVQVCRGSFRANARSSVSFARRNDGGARVGVSLPRGSSVGMQTQYVDSIDLLEARVSWTVGVNRVSCSPCVARIVSSLKSPPRSYAWKEEEEKTHRIVSVALYDTEGKLP